MSQHDFNIANQGFPAFRSDLNNALAALASNNLGAAAPAPTYAGMFWYESDTNSLWVRKSDNSGWILVAIINPTSDFISFTAHGVFRGADSLGPSSPVHSFTTDTDTGFYNVSANFLGVSTAGSYRAGWDSTGLYLHGKGADSTATAGLQIRPGGQLQITGSGTSGLQLYRYTSDGAVAQFFRDATQVGSISVTTTATAFNTSSDYRLKNEVTAPDTFNAEKTVSELATALKWYTWTVDKDKTDLGWYAHELAEIIPDAVTGVKDEVDEEGNPVYQGRNDTKLIPYLVAALDKAIKRIEALEQRITVLEG